jgi:acyl carrier protein
MRHDDIVEQLLSYVYSTNPVAEKCRPVPLEESLLDLGILDSFGVVELVSYIEGHWSIQILDSEITKEKFGGINKMARLIASKLDSRASPQAPALEG